MHCETTSASRVGRQNVRKAYIIASYREDHKGNPAQARGVVLGSGRVRKATIYHVLDFGPIVAVLSDSIAIFASRWRKWIKLSNDDETCIKMESYELTSY